MCIQIAVTHNNNTDKTSVEFMWTAPSMDVGGIEFQWVAYWTDTAPTLVYTSYPLFLHICSYTTVRNFTTFWVDETTMTIFGPEGNHDKYFTEGRELTFYFPTGSGSSPIAGTVNWTETSLPI